MGRKQKAKKVFVDVIHEGNIIMIAATIVLRAFLDNVATIFPLDYFPDEFLTRSHHIQTHKLIYTEIRGSLCFFMCHHHHDMISSYICMYINLYKWLDQRIFGEKKETRIKKESLFWEGNV